MSQQDQQQRAEEDGNHMDASGSTTSNANDFNELKLKMAALEVIWETILVEKIHLKINIFTGQSRRTSDQKWNARGQKQAS
jgi:hypothetical protein